MNVSIGSTTCCNHVMMNVALYGNDGNEIALFAWYSAVTNSRIRRFVTAPQSATLVDKTKNLKPCGSRLPVVHSWRGSRARSILCRLVKAKVLMESLLCLNLLP
jgi:hypothetical protein